ncbi:MAG: alkaline phosphatase family protein [bacterium]
MLKKCLISGALFGSLNGVVVALFTLELNHFPPTLSNLFLVPLFHILIYLPIGLLAGAGLFVLFAAIAKAAPSFAKVVRQQTAVSAVVLLLLASAVFGYRMLRSFPAQVSKHAIKYSGNSTQALNRTPSEGAWNKEKYIKAKPHFKLIVFALDAASFTVLDPLIAEGQLPTLKKLIDSGVSATVQTLRPTRSPIIWTTIASGKLPAEHGVWDFVLSKMPGTSFTRGRFKYPAASGLNRLSGFFADISFIPNIPYTSNLRRVKAFWNLLSEFERSVGLIGWYASFPAEPVNGFVVSDGFFYSSRYEDDPIRNSLTYPADLYHDIKNLASEKSAMDNAELPALFHFSDRDWQRVRDSKQFDNISYLLKLTYLRDYRTFEVAKKLLHEATLEDLDMFAVYFKALDEVSHAACEGDGGKLLSLEDGLSICWQSVVAAYKRADERIAEILKTTDENTAIMIVSDHGFSYGDMTGERKVGHWDGQDGIFILSGPNIKKDTRIEKITILDILPTLLYMENIPVALDFRGQVLTDVFEPGFVSANPVDYISTFEDRDAASNEPVQTKMNEEIEKKLKSLGYIN